MDLSAGFPEFPSSDEPVKVQKAKTFDHVSLGEVKCPSKRLLFGVIGWFETVDRFSKEEGCRDVESKSEEEWLEIYHPACLWQNIQQVLHGFAEELKIFVLTMRQLWPEKLS